ncbi:metal ABC transporter permease [Metabacillus idriensis]|uniref:metal ABC transporter permease n=1 Tax=Metabacillus idriensis TaxID=324768 RepID=UPI00174DD363|nr:metal ABC transporter permease [Metabacillus idriensis]
MMEEIFYQLQNQNTQWVLLGTMLLGLASGVLGSFALLRKQSLIGDAMAHAALPGVCMAFLLYGSKSLIWFLAGAAISGMIAAWLIQFIIQNSRIKEDSALGLVLSVFFGFGIVLLTFIQHNHGGNQSGLNDFIFGKAASMVGQDVQIITWIASILLLLTAVFFKEFKILTFDPQFAKGIGLPTTFFNGLLMVLIVCAVVIGLQTVGVILMAAMLITPAIAARYWTDKLGTMVIIAGIIGGISGVVGTFLSTTTKGMATGPLIIVAATLLFLFSLIFAPKRGLVSKAMKQIKLRKRTSVEQLLLSFYDLTEGAGGKYSDAAFSLDDIVNKRKVTSSLISKSLNELLKKRLITKDREDKWKLTENGLQLSYQLALNQRLYEMYLMHEMELAQLQISSRDDVDVEKMPGDMKDRLMILLKNHHREPMLLPKSKNSLSRKEWLYQ